MAESLDGKCQALLGMPPVEAFAVPKVTPVGGVYLFTENGQDLYAGRTRRAIGTRIRNHFGANPSAATLAWLLARDETGRKATYTKVGSRSELIVELLFRTAYDSAKARIRNMQVRYVHEPDPLRQALLEIYVAVATQARYNDFATH